MKFQLSFLILAALTGLQALAAPSSYDRQLSEANNITERDWISTLASEVLKLIESTAECAGCDVCTPSRPKILMPITNQFTGDSNPAQRLS
jgi:hypothetical protein